MTQPTKHRWIEIAILKYVDQYSISEEQEEVLTKADIQESNKSE